MLNIVSVSGGKDSTALYLWAIDKWGKDGFFAVFADTGHEHPVTYNYLRNLPAMANGPEIKWVNADFTSKIKRQVESPPKSTVHEIVASMIQRNSEFLKSNNYTFGNTFLDMCFSRSTIPRPHAQFCTKELKLAPMREWILELQRIHMDEVTLYNGVRAGESVSRSKLGESEENEFFDCTVVRPLLKWSETDVFNFLKEKGIPPNPLYIEGGAARVGCYPCIHSRKSELASLPEWAWDRLKHYEQVIGVSWFRSGIVPGVDIPTIDQVKEWSKTARGGKQFDLFPANEKDIPSCMSTWGVCE